MNKKGLLKGLLAAVLSATIATIFGSSATYAEVAISNGLFTGEGDVRWEWKKITDPDNTAEPEQVSIMFYDKPAAATTIVVPSLSDVITAASASESLNNYYVRSADLEAQAANYTEAGQEKRTSTADVTVLDMTNTSKVQIMGVKPIINPETEVELIFGENMVIGDGEIAIHKSIIASTCGNVDISQYNGRASCLDWNGDEIVFENIEENVAGWNEKTIVEQKLYNPTADDIVGCESASSSEFNWGYDPSNCYYALIRGSTTSVDGGAFANYKLKLTNLDNVKYLGWYAFQHSTLSEDTRSIVVKANQTAGEGVFAWSNVKGVTFEGSETFPAMFKGCQDLSEINFGNAETISYETFADTNLGTLNLSNTSVKNILGQAFKNANLTSINIEGVHKLDYESFANNNLAELYLPKSIDEMNTTRIFEGNMNLTKLTIAYDTLTSGTNQQLLYTIGEHGDGNKDNLGHRITDLTVLAPYGPNDEVSATHMTYQDWNINGSRIADIYDDYGVGFPHDYDSGYGKANTYKNVIAPGYFYGFWAIESLTIGEGYEFIGANAFYNYLHGPARDAWGRYMYSMDMDDSIDSGMINKSYHVSLPNTLKGIGGNAFSVHLEGDFQINLPDSLEYIGKKAFRCSTWFKNDFNLPNIKYIGTQAFLNTGYHDVYLGDSLEYVGYAPFEGGWNLHDATIDFDAFGLNSHLFEGKDGVSGVGALTVAMFGDLQGHNWSLDYSPHFEELLQLVDSDRLGYSGLPWEKILHKVGTIKFTSKATTPWPTDADENIYASWSSYGVFYGLVADKVDLSETNWKHLPQRAFLGANVGEVVLPHALEYIGRNSFQYSHIERELVLPDSVKVIGQDAFSMYGYLGYVDHRGIYTDGSYLNPTYRDKNGEVVELADGQRFSHGTPVKITKIPSSLEYVGGGAFYGNAWLEADFDCSNIKVLGYSAFFGTNLKSVTIGNKIRGMYLGAFYANENLKTLTFDGDISKAIFTPNNYYEYNNDDWPFSSLDNYHYGTYNIQPTLYPIFGQLDWFRYYSQDPDYDKEGWQNNRDELDSIIFTENATTTLSGAYDFAMYKIKNVDLSRVEWDNLPEGMFNNAEIDEIKLPIYLSMSKSCRPLQWANVTGKAILPEGANTIQNSLFQNMNAKELILPSSLRTIGNLAFFNARIEDELILPEGLTTIKSDAFNNAHYINTVTSSNPGGDPSVGIKVQIDKLPSTLEAVEDNAFFGYDFPDADLDLPNLKYIGHAAFMKTNLRDITLHDSLQYIGESAFMYNPNMRTITIDCDFFDINDGYSKQFYSIFGTLDRSRSNQSQSEDRGNFDGIIFTEKAVALPKPASFAFLNIGSLDISKTKWDTIPSDMFIEANIREPLVLPDSLKVIESGAFSDSDWIHSRYQGNPDGDISKKTSVKIAELPASLEVIGTDAFRGYQYELDLDLPNLKSIGTSAFMQANIKSVKLSDKIESIGSGAFLYIPSLRDIVIDFDFFGTYQYYSPYFYSVFSTVDPVLPVNLDTNWNPSQVQHIDGSSFNSIVFTEKATTKPTSSSFVYLDINSLDISRTGWTEIPYALFFETTIHEPLVLPETIETIADSAFLQSHLSIANELPEGLKTIGSGAFFAADCFDNLVIPSTVEYIGWSAFNAGPADVHYDSVTIKPANLSYSETSGQAVFQLLWNVKTDKLTIESETLPVINTLAKNPGALDEYIENSGQYVCYNYGDTFKDSYCLNADNEVTPIKQMPEFHGLNVKEVELPNIRAITANAFEDCAELEKVDFSGNSTLQFIGRNAFTYDNKLKTVIFDDALSGKDVSLGEFAFRGTAIESIGGADADFNLEAANFNAEISKLKHNDESGVDEVVAETDSYVFAEMPKLKTVSVPASFAYKNVPAYTFANNPELSKATLAWEVESLGDGTFLNDHKLARLFVWGDTNIEETEGFNLGASGDENNLTVPQGTMIFAYSDAPAEVYANAESRSSYDGKFYALDEVLYLTTNKNYVILNDDKTDFDKDGLKLYGLRRDGVILSSDWQTYDTAFQRTSLPGDAKNITFEEGRGALGSDDAAIAAEVFDARKPFEIISLANRNFENVSYELLQMPSGNNPIVAVHYPDGYTGNVRSVTLFSKTKEQVIEEATNPEPAPAPQPTPTPAPAPEEEDLVVPDTGTFGALAGAATSSLSIATIIVLGGLFIAKRRKN